MTLKDFNKLATQHKIENSSLPAYAVPPARYKQNNANELTKAVIAYIRYAGGQADRRNNMGVPNIVNGKFKGFRYSASRKGLGDIEATKPLEIGGRKIGLRVVIEIKYGKDRMSSAQLDVQKECESSGAVYLIVREFEQFVKDWEEIS